MKEDILEAEVLPPDLPRHVICRFAGQDDLQWATDSCQVVSRALDMGHDGLARPTGSPCGAGQ